MERGARSAVASLETVVLLDTLSDYFGRYLVLNEDQRTALAVWSLHTHIFDVFDTTPYLVITSAEPRCGKSRVFECLQPIVPNPRQLIALTEATLFRIVAQNPTLLIDETDALFNSPTGQLSERQDQIRGILNSGYRRGATVARCLAGDHEVRDWPTYCPKALAGIGHLPTTIEDRGLCIRLARRLASEEIERFRFRVGIAWGIKLKPQIEAWAALARIQLANAEPDMPDELDDRAQDSYEALVAIGDYASEDWGERVRMALIALRNMDTGTKESLGIRLFRDVGLFIDRLTTERMATLDFLSVLYEEGEQPWEDWWGASSSKKASVGLARILREYGVLPEQYKEAGVKKRGYRIEQILGAYHRYLGNEVGTSVPLALSEGLIGTDLGFPQGSGTDLEMASNPHGYAEGTVVPTSNGQVVVPGSLDWLATASTDEIRKYYEGSV